MGSGSKTFEGYSGRGEVVYLEPEAIIILGRDREATTEEWWGTCPRVEAEIDEGLIAAIQAGNIPPVYVRRDGQEAILVAGGRRAYHARVLNERLKKARKPPVAIPCLCPRTTPEQAFAIGVRENQKKGLRPSQLAHQIQTYVNSLGGRTDESYARCAELFQISKRSVDEHIVLVTELHPQVLARVDAGPVAVRVAAALATHPRAEQPAAMKRLEEAGATKGEAGLRAARAVANGGSAHVERGYSHAQLRRVLKVLTEVDGASVLRVTDLLSVIVGDRKPSEVEFMPIVKKAFLDVKRTASR